MILLNNATRDFVMTAKLDVDDNIYFQNFEKDTYFLKDYLFEMVFIIHPLLSFKYSNSNFISQVSENNKQENGTFKENKLREI